MRQNNGLWNAGVRTLLVCLTVVVATGCDRGKPACRQPAEPVTLASSLADMTNTARIALAPPGRGHMASSYDRTGGNRDWADPGTTLNADGSLDILTVEGPGCIHRIWMTAQSPAKWAFYFDGEDTPRLVGASYVAGCSSNSPNVLFQPPLCANVSGGHYSYVPIPFARSLRIVAQDGFLTSVVKKPYYQVNYSTFPKGSKVTSFPRELSQQELAVFGNVRAALAQNEEALRASADSCGHTGRLELAPGSAAEWLNEQKSGVLRCFWMSIKAADGTGQVALDRLLREISLEITWDDSKLPSINVPLGDFFFCPYAVRPFSSWYVGRADERFICRLPMPFSAKAVGRIRNGSSLPVVCEFGTDIGPVTRGPDMRYLHAEWRATEAVTSPPNRPHKVADIKGEGHYVGTYISVRGADGTWNILEGDDCMRVDGEEEPSLHGTGLEDYFDGAWYYRELADEPYSGLLDKAAMWTSQYRIHAADRVPFSKGFDFDFEFGHEPSSTAPANTALGYMSTVAYWYATAPGSVAALPAANARFPAATRLDAYMIMANLLELEAEGLHDVARQRCVAYGARFANTEAGDVISLRAGVYQSDEGDRNGALATYRRILEHTRFDSVKALGGYLVQEQTGTHAGIVCVQSTCPFSVYLDGRKLGEGTPSTDCRGYRVNLAPGRHELSFELKRTQGDPWILAEVRNASGVVTAAAQWEGSGTKPADWPQPGSTAGTWQSVPKAGTRLPTMEIFLLPPNPYVDVQSGVKFVRPFSVLDKANTAGTVYLRRSFQVGE